MTKNTDLFTELITYEHCDKPKFVQTVALSCQGFADLIDLCSQTSLLYDLDKAVGEQLDAIGLWVGLSRYVALNVETYFSWDGKGLGWDQGIWWEIGDARNEITQLSDEIYRNFIKLKIACNGWDGTLPSALAIMNSAVQPDGCTVIAKEELMSVTFRIRGTISKITQAVIEGGYLPLKPAGVEVIYQFEDEESGK